MPLPEIVEDQPRDVQIVTGVKDLLGVFRARRYELGLSQLATDEISGLASGHTAKIECGDKRLGPISMWCLLGALGLELHVVKTVPHHVKQGRVHVGPRLLMPRS